MLLGYVMIGLGLAGYAGKDIVYPLYKSHKSKKEKEAKDKNEITLDDRCEIYTQLFKNMGIMKGKDWIKVNYYIDKPCYTLTKFTLSDSISISSFIGKLDDIKNKLGVMYLEIYPDKTNMCFRTRKEKMPMENYEYTKTPHHLVKLGIDLDSNPIYWNLKSDPHVGLYANTGAGKSKMTKTPVCHIVQNDPRASFYFIDLKNGVEFRQFKDLQQTKGFAKDIDSAKRIISEVETEADKRYKIMEDAGYDDYYEYIKDKPRSKMTHCFIFIDEFADLMDDKKENTKNGKTEGYDIIGVLKRLARKMRFVAMHLYVGTQRCTKEYVDPNLKNNLTCTIGMRVMNKVNSELILPDSNLQELQKAQGVAFGDGKQQFFRSCYIDKKIIDSVLEPFITTPNTKVEVSNDIQEKHYDIDNVVDVDYQEIPNIESPFK